MEAHVLLTPPSPFVSHHSYFIEPNAANSNFEEVFSPGPAEDIEEHVQLLRRADGFRQDADEPSITTSHRATTSASATTSATAADLMWDRGKLRVFGANGRVRLLYQEWPGKNVPCCCGRCLMGPDFCPLLMNISLTAFHCLLFYAFVVPSIHWFVGVPMAVLWGVTTYNLFRATFTEPGIIPRQPPPSHPLLSEEHRSNGIHVTASGRTIHLKWCHTCNIYRPPRSHHCRDCDNCVEEWDHHCPWVCNCVAKRNYRYFVGFVFSMCVLLFYVCLFCVVAIMLDAAKEDLTYAIGTNSTAVYLIIFTAVFMCCLCGLGSYHCYLISSGMTTLESIRGRSGSHTNDFYENARRLFMSPLPPSRIDLRAPVIKLNMKGDSDLEMGSAVNARQADAPVFRDGAPPSPGSQSSSED